MRNPQDFVVGPEVTVKCAMEAIDRYGLRIVFVAEEGRLLGSLSDGDVRRHLLRGGSLEDQASKVMNPSPVTASVFDDPQVWREILERNTFTALPLVEPCETGGPGVSGASGVFAEASNSASVPAATGALAATRAPKLARIYYRQPVHEDPKPLDIPVVIQAGGKGTRLKPYTDVLPKPLIPIAGKTITEHIMDRCLAQGTTHFEMIINYRKNLIRAYFEDTENPYDVHFIEEDTFQGTAGGLRLALPYVGDRFFVHNCDVLLDLDFHDFVAFHQAGGYELTLVGAQRKMQVPYGTIEATPAGQVTELKEKPGIHFTANTGLYLVERTFLERLGDAPRIDITDAIEAAMAEGHKIGVYTIPGHAWLDMGQHDQLDHMREILEASAQ